MMHDQHPELEEQSEDSQQDPAGSDVQQPEPPARVDVHVQARRTPTAEDYKGEEWTREALVGELVRVSSEFEHVDLLIDRISRWLLDNLPEEITPEKGAVDVASIVIRLLTQYVHHPNGRLDGPVRAAIDGLDRLPGVDADEIRAQTEVVRAHLVHALTSPPRPGGGPEPVYESDDPTMLRYDRDRFRIELDLAYQTIASMFAAATGRTEPKAGVVEDLEEVRHRLAAAEQSLLAALASGGAGDMPVPVEGSPQYEAWAGLIREIVAGIADSTVNAETLGDAPMPVAGAASS